MPGMTGLDVLNSLRRRRDTRTLPVIVVTASDRGEERIRALEAGATDFLTKPVDPNELVARVRAHTRTRSAWLQALEDHVHWRGEIASMLCRIRPGAGLEVAAQEICRTLSRLPGLIGCAVYSFVDPGVTVLVAGSGPAAMGPQGRALPAERARFLADRAGGWPRLEQAEDAEDAGSRRAGRGSATVYASLGDVPRPTGLLVLSIDRLARADPSGTSMQMLSAAFEFAAISTSLLRPELEDQSRARADSQRVDDMLGQRTFRTVFQPVVDLKARTAVGYEALTRFDDGVPPDIWLAEAVRRIRPSVRLAVDDAGAGYASLRHVLMLRPDFVKLDQEWIRGVEGDAARQALIGALVLFARRTGSVLIAEGVETAAELETLDSLGVELGQGYFLGRPS